MTTFADKKIVRTRILIIDAPSILREGIASLVSMQPDMLLVGSAGEQASALGMFRSCNPDIALIDVQFGQMNGVDPIREIRGEFPQARIVALADRSRSRCIHAEKRATAGTAGSGSRGACGKTPRITLDRIGTGATRSR
jgi:DNA-binding NarL/FixJ family response regulator